MPLQRFQTPYINKIHEEQLCQEIAMYLRAILQESEAKLEMKNFNPPSFFVWR